ncbi:DUF423 domain-containing protein [Lacinutrix venerupis]|uniref:DUF423 domain-containing protein n=1 Tax=Lacinutrix venerupis TaxID=1486034 RepID=A0AAC9LKI5_9FLAO|nr:DUF423 domain-containing protein [Lacinutrix venerupis]APX99252.1 hypothetical protein BWR22_02655 [Lacinutrix venerupis]
MNKKVLILGSVFGLLAVIIGAFAAHGLKPKISPSSFQSFETGVRYQMYHALFLLFIGGFNSISEKTKKYIFYLIGFGVLFFSGSIYCLATNGLTAINFSSIGFITPIGGLLLILSWLLLFIEFVKKTDK